jgi:type IV secretory pathway TrbF-like protein
LNVEVDMKKVFVRTDLPERVQYTKYYEHDGMLRAYANRAMLLAILFAVIAMSSLGFAIYVRVQPPTVVRVDENGNATAVGHLPGQQKAATLSMLSTAAATDTAPSELEAIQRKKGLPVSILGSG